MRAILAFVLLAASQSFAQQPTPEQQVVFLQSALQSVQQQRNQAMDQLAVKDAQLDALKKELDAAKKPAESNKK